MIDMKKRKLTQVDKEDLQYHGLMRLVGGIILQVLDNCLISGKWYPRDLSMDVLKKKRKLLKEMLVWFKDPKWDIWLNIYCGWTGFDKRMIKKNFRKIRRQSEIYTNKRIKEKKQREDTARESGNTREDGCEKTEANI